MDAGNVTSMEFSLTLRRQFHTFVFVAAPLLAIIAGIAFGLPDIYRSTAVIRIDRDRGNDNRAVDTYAEYYVETLVGQVLKRNNFDTWVQEFDLFADEKTWSDVDKRAELRKNLNTDIVTTLVIDPFSGREHDVVTGFEVSYMNFSPIDAQKVASAAADAFLVENRRSRLTQGQEEIDFFAKEAETYRTQIAEVEARMANFKERYSRSLPEVMQVNMRAMDRVDLDMETTRLQMENLKRERVILQAQLSQIPTTSDEAIEQLAALQNEYVRVSSIYQETHPSVISVRKQIDSLSQTVDSAAAIPILRQQRDEISVALIEARERYSDDHPDVRKLLRSERALDERIAELSARSGVERTEVVSTNNLYIQMDTQIKAIDSQVSGLSNRLYELRVKRDGYDEQLLQTPQVEREYRELERDLANVRKLYDATQEQQREAELSLALTAGARGDQLTMAQTAYVPDSPAWPPRAAILVLGIILAMGCGIGIATLREITSGMVRGSSDIIDLCGAPPIALVPLIRNRSRRVKSRAYAAGFLASVGAIGSLAYFGAQVL